jgi:NitT/TauT family transport system permease protein
MTRLRPLLPHWDKVQDQIVNAPWYYAQHWLETFSVSAAACALAALFALILSIMALRYAWLDRVVSPVTALSQSFPLQALGPVIIIAFGPGFFTKIAIALVITFFPIQNYIATAFIDTPSPYLQYARVCKAGFLTTFYFIRLPFALPRIIAALKVGFTLSVIGSVVAEFIAPQGGVGEILLIAQSSFDIEAIYICLLILIVQGLAIHSGLSWLERRLAQQRYLPYRGLA